MKVLKLLLLLLLFVIGITFACLNDTSVSLNYYIQTIELPLSLLLAFVFAFGGVLGLLVSLKIILKSKAQVLGLKRQLKKSKVQD